MSYMNKRIPEQAWTAEELSDWDEKRYGGINRAPKEYFTEEEYYDEA